MAGGAGLFAYAQALTQRTGTQPVRALFLIAAIALAALALRSFYKRKLISGLGLVVLAPLALLYYVLNETVNNPLLAIPPAGWALAMAASALALAVALKTVFSGHSKLMERKLLTWN